MPMRIGPYQVLDFLGQGGMGAVYLTRSRGGRSLAVKVIRADLAANRDFRRRFAREVAAARKVSGAYTAPVVDADTECVEPWLATMFVPGRSLWETIRAEGALDGERARELGAGLAEALIDIHAAGIIHRDLKPHNVLMGADGPRVIDFGIAHVADLPPLTDPGALLGTPQFMSPEQIKGNRLTFASDVFSFGLVLAYTAIGGSPFGPGSNAQLLLRTLHEDPDLTALPGGLRQLVAACLARRPEQRPSPSDLLDTLAAVTAPDPQMVRPAPLPPVPTVWVPEAGRGGTDFAHSAHAAPGSTDFARNAHAVLDDGLTDALVIEAARHDG
jgi:eukaryotic-like serine/threonine-protein kinase